MIRYKSVKKDGLTQELLKELLHYNPDTGIFTWLKRDRGHFDRGQDHTRWNTKFSGKVAGSIRADGYRRIRFLGYYPYAHQLAFLYIEGEISNDETDHINGVRDDNRWLNLRTVTPLENMQNQRLCKKNKSGCHGVHWRADMDMWKCGIGVNGKGKHLGHFNSLFDAAAVRKQAEIKYGYHENHGRCR